MRAISSMATRHVLVELAGAAASAALPRIEVESVGGVDAARRVAAGEAFDLVFLAVDALEQLGADGHISPSSITPLMVSQTVAAVPANRGEGASTPLTDAESVRAVLRGARRIGYSTGPSGTALVRMIDEWEMSDEIGDRLVQARPGVPVARALSLGEVDLGFQQLSEFVGASGVHLLGALPDDCAIDTIFGGAVATAAGDAGAAGRALEFLASDQVVDTFTAFGFRGLRTNLDA